VQQHLHGLRQEQDRDGQDETNEESGLEVTDHMRVMIVPLVFVVTRVALSHVVTSMRHLGMHVVGHIVMHVFVVFHVWPPVDWRITFSLRQRDAYSM